MDFSFWIVLWIIILVVQNVLDKKKPKPPPPNNSQKFPDFEIPTLANDPNFPGEENQILFPKQDSSAEVREINLEDYYREKKSAVEKNFHKENKIIDKVEEKKLPIELSPESAMQGIIWGEILGKPKALRNKR